MKGRGNAKVMQCGYHAWTYQPRGLPARARRAPRTNPGFRLEDYPLLPLRVEHSGRVGLRQRRPRRGRCASSTARCLDVIAQSGIDLDSPGALFAGRVGVRISNWKTMLENYLECYHCAVAHPGFSAAIDVQAGELYRPGSAWLVLQPGRHRARQSALEGRSQVKIYDAAVMSRRHSIT